jgi:hypothetical protein
MLEDLSKDVLLRLIQVSSRNWGTTDGLWFQGVEDKYGIEAALELDKKMWERLSIVAAKRIKEALDLQEGGIAAIINVVDILSTLLGARLPEIKEQDSSRVVLQFSRCPYQEARIRQGRSEFPCKPVGFTLLLNSSKVADPSARVNCLVCLPDPHPKDVWCKWELTIGGCLKM